MILLLYHKQKIVISFDPLIKELLRKITKNNIDLRNAINYNPLGLINLLIGFWNDNRIDIEKEALNNVGIKIGSKYMKDLVNKVEKLLDNNIIY